MAYGEFIAAHAGIWRARCFVGRGAIDNTSEQLDSGMRRNDGIGDVWKHDAVGHALHYFVGSEVAAKSSEQLDSGMRRNDGLVMFGSMVR
jgi:hypothetical protein